MRKPDPTPPLPSAPKRTSTAPESAPRKSSESAGNVVATGSSSDTQTTQPVAGVKRKKSRVYLPVDEEEESEGAQADAEYSSGIRAGSSSNWVTDARRRSALLSSRRQEDELRRHSMAV